MILNTGQRTDIPAFFSEWFANRIREGFVLVRNPYNPSLVTRYEINPQVVDAIGFCTKNPAPFFPYLDLVKDFGQFWYVTITPYGKDIEPGVPDKSEVIESFKYLSGVVGAGACGWRYDPIFIDPKYTVDFHLQAFEKMASALEGFTKIVVISFIDLYEKVKRNFPQVREVSPKDKLFLGRAIIKIAGDHGMIVKPCGEGDFLAPYGADCGGCMTIKNVPAIFLQISALTIPAVITANIAMRTTTWPRLQKIKNSMTRRRLFLLVAVCRGISFISLSKNPGWIINWSWGLNDVN